MTVGTAEKQGYLILKRAKIISAILDTELLLAFTLKKTKEYVMAHPEKKLTRDEWRRFFSLIRRRGRHEPLAYLTGHKEFYGLDFLVNRQTLIPRPETELLVETVVQQLHPTRYPLPPIIIDIGTGSGAIAVALAKSLQTTDHKPQFYATDISESALRVAHQNTHHHGVKIKFLKGNLLEPFFKSITSYRLPVTDYQLMITANLPYLTTKQWRRTQPEIKKYEPRNALDGGPDGLKYYRQLFSQIKKLPITSYQLPVTIYIEIDPSQSCALTKLVKKIFPAATIEIKKDLSDYDRIMIVKF